MPSESWRGLLAGAVWWCFVVALCAVGSGSALQGCSTVSPSTTAPCRQVRAGHNHSLYDLRAKAGNRNGTWYPSKPYPEEWVDRAVKLLDLEALLAFELGKHWPEHDVKLTIKSGYRYPALNRAVGGARRSQHMEGLALDLVPWWRRKGSKRWRRMPVKYLWAAVKAVHKHNPIGGAGVYWSGGHVHIDLRDSARPVRWSVP